MPIANEMSMDFLDLDIEKILLSRTQYEIEKKHNDKALMFLRILLSMYPKNNIAIEKLKWLLVNRSLPDLSRLTFKPTLRNKIKKLLRRKLAYKPLISYNILHHGLSRHSSVKNKLYFAGDKITCEIYIPKDGKLLLIHYDDKCNITFLFPIKESDNINVKAGEKVAIGIELSKPTGKNYLKAILLPINSRVKIRKCRYDADSVADILHLISKLTPGTVEQATYDFTVKEKSL